MIKKNLPAILIVFFSLYTLNANEVDATPVAPLTKSEILDILKHVENPLFENPQSFETCISTKGNVKFEVIPNFDKGFDCIKWKVSLENQKEEILIETANGGEFYSRLEVELKKEGKVSRFKKDIIAHAVHLFKNGSIIINGGMAHINTFEGHFLFLSKISKINEPREIFTMLNGFPVYLGSTKQNNNNLETAIFAIIRENKINSIVAISSDGAIKINIENINIRKETILKLYYWGSI